MKLDLRKKIIREWANDLPLKEKIIKLFEKVRDIPYGDIGSRDPEDVYKKNKGTCSGKHELLKELYTELGIKTKNFIAMHEFNDLSVRFPNEIKEILNRNRLVDPHNFLKIFIDGKWVIVDATWDKLLKEYGFTVNENWDGKKDMKIGVVVKEIIETDNPLEVKEQKIGSLPIEVQKDRKLFLKELNKWLEKLRKE